MSLAVSQGEGLTVLTIASNPNSKWPVLCQILGALCYSPVCSVSQVMRGKLTSVHTAFGTMQIIVGVLSIVLGIFFTKSGSWNNISDSGIIFWIGSVTILTGIVTILSSKFPSSCLLVMAMIVNVVSGGLAITAVVLCSVDLARGNYLDCNDYYFEYSTPSPERIKTNEICMEYKYINQMILGGLDIMMIVLSVLQLCVVISFCVLTGKALCGKTAKPVEDPEIHKPLLEDALASPAC